MPKINPASRSKGPVVKIKTPGDRVILALEEKGFAVGLMRDGTTIKAESREVSEFVPLIKQSAVTWVDYVVDDLKKEAPGIAKAVGFSESLVDNLVKNPRSGYEDYDSEMGIMIPAIVVEGFDVKLNPLLILIRKNLVVTLHTTELRRFFRLRRYAETFMRKIESRGEEGVSTSLHPSVEKITAVLIRIIDENNGRNFDHLREIEENADKVSEQLADPKTSREIVGPQIHQMKHALITYLGGLWSTVDVLNTLRYGDPELLTDDPKLLSQLTVLTNEVQNQIALTEHLSEVLASGLEVLQSIYNNQLQILNNKMAMLVAYLTIIGTAVLVPNTIATALSNPAFQMGPEDAGWYIGLLVLSTVVSTLISYWWVKNRGLLPSNPHTD